MYVIVWEFHVKQGCQAEFERAYGPAGLWTELFQRAKGYLGTELLQDAAHPLRYLTIDRWTSAAAYDAFRSSWTVGYETLDARCEELTESEALLGMLTSAPEDERP